MIPSAAVLALVKKIVWPLVDDMFGSDSGRIKNELDIKLAEVDLTTVQGQIDIVGKEVSGDKLQRSWRPHLMYLLMAVIVGYVFIVPFYNFILFPLLVSVLWYEPVKIEVSGLWDGMPTQLWTLMQIGIGGYIGSRGLEKMIGTPGSRDMTRQVVDVVRRRKPESEIPTLRKKPTRRVVPVQRAANLPVDVDVGAENGIYGIEASEPPVNR